MDGYYVVFEGADGVGKTTTMKAVIEQLKKRYPKFNKPDYILSTQHPGSTPLGAHLRQLVKYPKKIDPAIEIDDLSRQMLYMVDTVNFIKQLLEPSLSQGKIVFADRTTFISALVYGIAEGLQYVDIERLFSIIRPPQISQLYILSCPWQVCRERIRTHSRGDDHYDLKSDEFFKQLEQIYNNLCTTSTEQTMLVQYSVSVDNINYIDSTRPQAEVVKRITDSIVAGLHDHIIGDS